MEVLLGLGSLLACGVETPDFEQGIKLLGFTADWVHRSAHGKSKWAAPDIHWPARDPGWVKGGLVAAIGLYALTT